MPAIQTRNGPNPAARIETPRGVDIAGIERELAELWKSAAPSGPESSPVLRACSLNLVVVCDQSSQLEEIAGMVGDLTAEHPGRVFLVQTDPRSLSPLLETWISARCALPLPGEKQICCEQITLVAAGRDVAKVPSIVTSLLVADVPSVLLWKAKLDETAGLLAPLVAIMDRMLIDSSEHCNPEDLLRRWGRLMEQGDGHVTFCDLAWTHITGWRGMIAQAFQPAQHRVLLREMSSLEIQYSSSTTPVHSGLSQALLLVSWLAERLSWKGEQPGSSPSPRLLAFAFRAGERRVSVTLEEVAVPPGEPGGLERVRINLAPGSAMTWSMKPGRDAVECLTQTAGTPAAVRTMPVNNRSEAALIARELEVLQRDIIYEKSMALLKPMVREGNP